MIPKCNPICNLCFLASVSARGLKLLQNYGSIIVFMITYYFCAENDTESNLNHKFLMQSI